MAEYRLSASVISRGDGRAAVAAAAYRSGTCLACERYGERHDYTRRSGVRHEQILAPDNAPSWMRDREQLWNAVERVERKSNAQLSREIQLNLPHELTHDQRRELVVRFVQKTFVAQGMIADLAIHDPHKPRDLHGKPLPDDQIPPEKQRNYHAHVMLTMRELTGDGFHAKKSTPKAREWNNRNNLTAWRTAWAAEQNADLARYGHAARVSEKSLKDQGIDRMPQIHLGSESIANQRRYEAGKQAAPDPRFTRNVEILKANRSRAQRLADVRDYLHLKQRVAEIARQRRAVLQQLEAARREAQQLQGSIERTGLRGLIDTVTGKRRAEKQRLEDLQTETRRHEAAERAQRLNSEAAKAAQQRQRAARRSQEALRDRVAHQQETAANDHERAPQASSGARSTVPKKSSPTQVFAQSSVPKPPASPTRPVKPSSVQPQPSAPKVPRRGMER